MASSQAKECGVCNEEYNEELNCPRILPCYHSLCTNCIDRLIRGYAKNCPFCRKGFEAKSAREFRINNNTLDLMKYIAELEGNSPISPRRRKDRSPAGRSNYFVKGTEEVNKENLINCERAEYQIKRAIRNNKKLRADLSQDNMKLKNEILVIINEMIGESDQHLEDVEEEHEKLKNQLMETREKHKLLTEAKVKLEAAHNDQDEAASLINEAEVANSDVKTWLQDFEIFISRNEGAQQDIERSAERDRERINAVQKALSFPEETPDDEFAPSAPDIAAMSIHEPPLQITPENLRELSDPMRALVEQGKIYAIQHIYPGKTAKISLTKDDKLCLHHLGQKPPPPYVHTIKYFDFMRMLDHSPRLVFLDLGTRESTIGRIYIRFRTESKRAKHFIMLCTGEFGPSYANTRILKVGSKGKKGEYIRCGDYERNDGTGGKALLTDMTTEFGKNYHQPILAGTVSARWLRESDSNVAQFYIFTRSNSDDTDDASFGMVEEGLGLLNEVVTSFPDIRDVSICDCGIVLNDGFKKIGSCGSQPFAEFK